MTKYRIIIEKYREVEIKARTEDEAVDIAWEWWSEDDDGATISVEKCEEE